MKLKGQEIIIWDDENNKLGHYFAVDDIIYLELYNEYINVSKEVNFIKKLEIPYVELEDIIVFLHHNKTDMVDTIVDLYDFSYRLEEKIEQQKKEIKPLDLFKKDDIIEI